MIYHQAFQFLGNLEYLAKHQLIFKLVIKLHQYILKLFFLVNFLLLINFLLNSN